MICFLSTLSRVAAGNEIMTFAAVAASVEKRPWSKKIDKKIKSH